MSTKSENFDGIGAAGISTEDYYRVVNYIYYMKNLADKGNSCGLVDDLDSTFSEVYRLRCKNEDVNRYISKTLELHALEKRIRELEKERVTLNREILSLQKKFFDGFQEEKE